MPFHEGPRFDTHRSDPSVSIGRSESLVSFVPPVETPAYTGTSLEDYALPADQIRLAQQGVAEVFTDQTDSNLSNSSNSETAPVIGAEVPEPPSSISQAQTQTHKPLVSKNSEIESIKPNVRVRKARPDDLDDLAEIDVDSFWDVYKEYGKTRSEMVAEMKEKFSLRLTKVGYDWVQVLEDKEGGDLIGFMMCCPTSKRPEDFVSWEDTTDNGTLETTFDPEGENLYVVSLTMAKGTLHTELQNMLYANLMGKFISEGFSRAFFEARLPGLRAWMTEYCEQVGCEIDDLDDSRMDELANEYLHLTKTNSKGKEVPLDPLIRTFSTVGCEFVKVVPNAYEDAPSMNYGVVSVFESPLPKLISSIAPIRKMIGTSLRLASHSYELMKRLF